MSFTLFLVVGAAVMLLVSGTYVFLLACVRHKDIPWLDEEKIKKTSFGKYYDYIVTSDRWLKEHNAKDICIQSADGLMLHGLWIPAEHPRGTVLFAHGYRSTYLVDFGAAFSFYHARGMNLLIPDQRAHGKSQGRYITFGVKESEDMKRWIAYHNSHFQNIPIVLCGISMGASTMLFLADQNLASNVCGIIADCGFSSPKEIICEVFRRVIHLPPAPSVWVADVLARIFAKFSLYEKDTRKILKNSKLPILMVHGKEDGFVPCKMSEDACAVCAGEKQLLLVDDADHGLSFIKDPDSYMSLVETFLDKHIGRQ